MLESHFPNYTNRNSILELNANIPHFMYIYIYTHTHIYTRVLLYIMYIFAIHQNKCL